MTAPGMRSGPGRRKAAPRSGHESPETAGTGACTRRRIGTKLAAPSRVRAMPGPMKSHGMGRRGILLALAKIGASATWLELRA
jgi:hypothetical protein